MRAILLYYIYSAVSDGGLELPKTEALYVVSLLGASVQITSAIGGWVADRILSPYRAVIVGGVIIAIGHLILGIHGAGKTGLFIALTALALGTGLLKPNVAQMVGSLYKNDNVRRTAGFNIYVMGINIGAFISPLVVGTVQKLTDFNMAFMLPAAFMLIMLVLFTNFAKKDMPADVKQAPNPLTNPKEIQKILFTVITSIVVIIAVIVLLILTNLMTLDTITIITPLAALSIAVYLFGTMLIDKDLTKAEKRGIIGYTGIFVAGVVFWASEELQATVFAALAQSRTNNVVGAFEIPESWYQSVNPLVIILLAPVFAVLWTKLKRQPSTLSKIIIGLVLTGLSFIVPALGFLQVGSENKINLLYIVIPIFMFTVGELLISPIGMSATSVLSPHKYQSRMMALWYLNVAVGDGINAFVSRFFDDTQPAPFFFGYSITLFAIIIILTISFKKLKQLMVALT
jgi:POT family proton-dependent oligopeptide transporter